MEHATGSVNFYVDSNFLILAFFKPILTQRMTKEQFKASLSSPTPPNGISPILEALWHEAKGDWQTAHEIAQSKEGTRDYDRIHAYLHRAEGDTWNAGYWYRRAGTEVFRGTLEEEMDALIRQFCS